MVDVTSTWNLNVQLLLLISTTVEFWDVLLFFSKGVVWVLDICGYLSWQGNQGANNPLTPRDWINWCTAPVKQLQG